MKTATQTVPTLILCNRASYSQNLTNNFNCGLVVSNLTSFDLSSLGSANYGIFASSNDIGIFGRGVSSGVVENCSGGINTTGVFGYSTAGDGVSGKSLYCCI